MGKSRENCWKNFPESRNAANSIIISHVTPALSVILSSQVYRNGPAFHVDRFGSLWVRLLVKMRAIICGFERFPATLRRTYSPILHCRCIATQVQLAYSDANTDSDHALPCQSLPWIASAQRRWRSEHHMAVEHRRPRPKGCEDGLLEGTWATPWISICIRSQTDYCLTGQYRTCAMRGAQHDTTLNSCPTPPPCKSI